jgi:hypothetical protein
MKFKSATLALAGMILMTGCSSIVSLQPLVAEKDATTDPGLPGTWMDAEGKDTFIIRRNGAAYAFTYIEKSGTAYKFDGRLWKIGDTLLLDLVTTNEAPFHLPVHFAMRVWVDRDTLRMAFYDTDWFKKLVAEQLATQKVDDRTVITSAPEAIRAFYLAHAADEKAHGDPDTLHRTAQ